MSSRSRGALAALAASIMFGTVVAACGGSSSSTIPATGASVPADETRAAGPLTGNPALVAGEQSCAQAEKNQPWYPTIAAFEVHDSDRTHLYDCAHFPGSTSSGRNTVCA